MNDQPYGSVTNDDEMATLLQQIAAGDGDDVTAIDAVMARYPFDSRLHFLRGSVLAGSGHALEAHQSLTRAVELAPDFAIARFQLGFFELTSGEPRTAEETWAPLTVLPTGHYLRHFVSGLNALIADQFVDCVAALRAGIAVNEENPALNNDMQLIIAQCNELIGNAGGDSTGDIDSNSELSATSLLLNRFGTTISRN
ncbi:MAG: hypothetical protein AABZ45_02435 [Pseudomonadota bacterium]